MKSFLGTLARVAVTLAVVGLPACGGQIGLEGGGKGQVAITLSAGSGPAALHAGSEGDSDHACALPQAAVVTFSALLARTLDGDLVDVTIDLPATVDLLSLVGGQEATLPVGFLPPGTYDQFVVVMRSLELTLADGWKITLTPPGGGWTAILAVAEPFTVVEGETTAVHFVFRADRSFTCALGRWDFHPVFEHRR